MPLTACPSCGARVPDSARACPACKHDLTTAIDATKTSSAAVRWLSIGILVLVIAFAVVIALIS